MSTFSSFFPTKLLGSINPRDRAADPLSRLRFALETMPGSRKYVFSASTRAEILTELFDAFWGPYSHLFIPNSTNGLPLPAALHEVQASFNFGGAGQPDPIIPGRPCGRIFKKGESCFRCKECALDDSCVLCSRCFHATDHTGHNVSFFIAQQSGSCCDCGDEEAWRLPLNCRLHPPISEANVMTDISFPTTPKANVKWIGGTSVPPVEDYPYRVSVPPELRECMCRTVAYALDFLLDTLDYSPDEPSVPTNEADLRLQPSADPMMKDQYCVILWNDDKHSMEEVIQLVCDLTTRSREEASELVHRVDEDGREVVDMTTNVTRLLEVAQIISQIDLGVTIRRAYDTFREQIAAVLIEWLLDVSRCRLGTDTLILREIISSELMLPRKRDTGAHITPGHTFLDDVPNATRIDWMFLYHTRLWKKPRLSLKEIYASILTLSHEHKLAIAGHFANAYHRVIDAYLLVDREAETSIKYIALQLFTVPSVAIYIVRHHNIITRLLGIISAFFTNQIEGKRIVYPPNLTAVVDVDSFPFKSKRFMPVFSDLRYLCHNEPVQQLIAHNREYLDQFLKTCQLFMCINPNKRAATNHIEYETDAWISVFNVTLSLSRVIKVYGEAFSRATLPELISAITTVIHHILMVCTLTDDTLDRNKFTTIHFHDEIFGDTAYQIVQFDVMEGWVSFHHSLHWLLAELFKHVDTLNDAALRQLGFSDLRDVIVRSVSERDILTLIDFPLRVLAMIAQIRTGLWVRNGFAIRGQLLHYRDFMLRELCYDQDLFIIQTAFIILHPNVVIISILDRFGLLDYFRGELLHPTYEGSQLSSMVEEVLYILITILSEGANASKLPLHLAVRREIVHALAMGPCSFSDLVKRVSERMVDDICFEQVLKEVATFKPPESTTDIGMYELKDEAFDEVNPFFYHYSRNKREDVDTILRNRLKKKIGALDPVIVPKPLGITGGPFVVLSSAFESEALLQVMFYAIYNILVTTESAGYAPPSAEAILDQTLHLVMLSLVERGAVFSHLSSIKFFEEEKTLIDVICTLEHHEKYKPYRARVEWILSVISVHVPHEVQSRRRMHGADAAALDSDDSRKRAAKARQEAIMKQMKAQQASFAINFDDADEDEDEVMVETPEIVSYGTCIVCQEDLNASRSFGALGLIQPSRFIRRHPDSQIIYLNEVLQTSPTLDRSSPTASSTFPPREADLQDAKFSGFEGFPARSTRFGLYSSICSHMMHLDCFHVYTVSIRGRHRSQGTRGHPESIPRKEYICPLCKSLGNVILPVICPPMINLSTVSFSDWIRAAGISILKSKPDPLLESLQFRNGTGEFVFWSAQDPGYTSLMRNSDKAENLDIVKMVDTLMIVSKSISQQTRHLRDRAEPEPNERGAGIYLPEELVSYSIACIEVAQRGVDSREGSMAFNLSDSQTRMIRGLLVCLTKLAAMHFKGRLDEGREAIRQAIVKRLLPEWSRTSLTSFSYPLLLRDPFTVLVETAAIAPEMLRHVLILVYYACLARTVVGLVYILNKTKSYNSFQIGRRSHEDIFGDTRMFFMSVVRHSPVVEHTATLVFDTFGEARIEKLLYAFTLPFLRRAAILCQSVLPSAFPTPSYQSNELCEYIRLLRMLGIPPLSDLPKHDTLQNALSGWCAHYGHSHAASQLNCGLVLDYPTVYRIARLPLVLDNIFEDHEKTMTCHRCFTVPVDAAVCLICGMICCMQSTCCMDGDRISRGECNMHTRDCGGVIGLYYLVKRCSLLYLYAGNGTFAPSPYLDVHGEVDVSMRRGRRQYLHHVRWEEVRKTWLNHSIPTIVARKLESSVDFGGWESL